MSTPPTTKLSKAKQSAALLTDAIKTEMYATVDRKYIVSEATLDEMVSGYNSVFSVFFGILAGIAGVLWGFWNQCITQPTRMYYAQFATIATVLAVICGVIFISNYWKASSKKRKLYKEAKLIHSTDPSSTPSGT